MISRMIDRHEMTETSKDLLILLIRKYSVVHECDKDDTILRPDWKLILNPCVAVIIMSGSEAQDYLPTICDQR